MFPRGGRRGARYPHGALTANLCCQDSAVSGSAVWQLRWVGFERLGNKGPEGYASPVWGCDLCPSWAPQAGRPSTIRCLARCDDRAATAEVVRWPALISDLLVLSSRSRVTITRWMSEDSQRAVRPSLRISLRIRQIVLGGLRPVLRWWPMLRERWPLLYFGCEWSPPNLGAESKSPPRGRAQTSELCTDTSASLGDGRLGAIAQPLRGIYHYGFRSASPFYTPHSMSR